MEKRSKVICRVGGRKKEKVQGVGREKKAWNHHLAKWDSEMW